MSDNKDTIILVGKTEVDGYGNLWVIPEGGGERVKIAKKRESLFPLFQQGKAVMLHYEVYMNKPYVSNAELVEGNLPSPKKAELSIEQEAKVARTISKEPAPQELGMWFKEAGELVRMWKLHPETKPTHKVKDEVVEYPWVSVLIRKYYSQMLNILDIKSEEP